MKIQFNFKKAVSRRTFLLVVLLGPSLSASQAFAGDFLAGDELKKLVSGNTVHFDVEGKGKFRAYLDSNGKVARAHDGKILEGTWRIKNDGALCIHYTGKADLCGKVKKNKDGTYTRIDDAKVTNHWTKISKGKDL